MTLLELIEQVAEWAEDEATIYVEQPGRHDADAILISPAPASTEPLEKQGKSPQYACGCVFMILRPTR